MQTSFDSDSPVPARAAIMNYLVSHGASLGEPIRTKLIELTNMISPVDSIVRVAELIYANSGNVDNDARDLAGSLASHAAANSWHGLAEDGRGHRISLAMKRDNGEDAPEGSSFPDPADDPEPKAEYVIPAE